MSWATNFTAEINLMRERFDTEYELDEKIQDTKECIQQTREKLLMICMGNKDSFSHVDSDGNICHRVDIVHMEVNNMLNYLHDLHDDLLRYELLKENFENREVC